MIRKLLLPLALISLVTSAAADDHRNEVGLLLGGIVTQDRNLLPGPGTIDINTGLTFQATYAPPA